MAFFFIFFGNNIYFFFFIILSLNLNFLKEKSIAKQRSPRSPREPLMVPLTHLSAQEGPSLSVSALISPRKAPSRRRDTSGSTTNFGASAGGSNAHSTVESKVREKFNNIKERRWITESHGSNSHTSKRRSRDVPREKKKERTTPFNLPIQELPTSHAAPEESYDNTVLKVPILTTGPTNSDVAKKFPEIDQKTLYHDLSELPSGCRVIIVCLENMCLCRMEADGKSFADGQNAFEPDTQFTLFRKEGHSECKFKNVQSHKYFMSRENFSNMNNYLTRFKKKQYHCLYFSKGSKEVLIGTGQERSMFKVFKLDDKYQKSNDADTGV